MNHGVSLWLSRPAEVVAPELLGCILVRKIDGIEYRGIIVETEAYAPGDPACHAYKKRSERNAAMFGKAGFIYVYLIYGIYHCINLVTDLDGVPSAVLIRALALDKIPPWIDRNSVKNIKHSDRLGAGPGKLCRTLKIDRSLNGTELKPQSDLWLEIKVQDNNKRALEIVQTTRIGISKGGDIPWRWYVAGHPAVSILHKNSINTDDSI
jgi:DNA-3-methyladenine glycosylase